MSVITTLAASPQRPPGLENGLQDDVFTRVIEDGVFNCAFRSEAPIHNTFPSLRHYRDDGLDYLEQIIGAWRSIEKDVAKEARKRDARSRKQNSKQQRAVMPVPKLR